jgi:hypothetical protein
MASSDQEMLDLINEVLTKRLRGDGYQSYNAQQQQFQGAPLKDLFDLRDRLQRSINAASGASFGLAEPFCE